MVLFLLNHLGLMNRGPLKKVGPLLIKVLSADDKVKAINSATKVRKNSKDFSFNRLLHHAETLRVARVVGKNGEGFILIFKGDRGLGKFFTYDFRPPRNQGEEIKELTWPRLAFFVPTGVFRRGSI